MRFGGLAGALEDVRFGGMIDSEISLARRDLRNPRGSDGRGAEE
jgi:hypothetical protein